MKMKKYFFMLLLIPILAFAGCGKESVKDNMSEVTHLYFFGEQDGYECSISVGLREQNYIMDGKHGQTCEFSLVSLKCPEVTSDKIEVTISIDGNTQNLSLEFNPLNSNYMADLGYNLSQDASVFLSFQNVTISLVERTSSFDVNYDQAIDIALATIGKEADCFYKNNSFLGEGYLKILDGTRFGGDGLFWCFTIVGEEQISKNVLIDVYDKENIILG